MRRWQVRERIAKVFGLYRHKKGGLYLALGLVKHSETGEAMVLYVGRAGWFVRPATMFFDGRFRKLGARQQPTT